MLYIGYDGVIQPPGPSLRPSHILIYYIPPGPSLYTVYTFHGYYLCLQYLLV